MERRRKKERRSAVVGNDVLGFQSQRKRLGITRYTSLAHSKFKSIPKMNHSKVKKNLCLQRKKRNGGRPKRRGGRSCVFTSGRPVSRAILRSDRGAAADPSTAKMGRLSPATPRAPTSPLRARAATFSFLVRGGAQRALLELSNELSNSSIRASYAFVWSI